MQVVGSSLLVPAVQMVARRATRDEVRVWAERVIFRHIKRTQSLMARVATRDMLEAVLSKEQLNPEAVERIQLAFDGGEEFFAPSGNLVTEFLRHAADTMDFVCSLPDNDRRIKRIDRMSWVDAEVLSEAWHATLAKKGKRSRDLIAGTRRIMEFDGGMYVAELVTPEALMAEGNAMGHCVGGYWLRVQSGATRIVSLRDQRGYPHVTIELGGAPRMRLDDGQVISVDRYPRHGRDVVSEMTADWAVVQVRGKENKAPVEKWQRYVNEYFSKTGMVRAGFGGRFGGSCAGPKIVTFRVGDIVGLDPDHVAAAAEPLFSEAIKSSASDFGEKYRKSGLEAVHCHCTDFDRVASQAEQYLPLSMASVSALVARGVPFHRSVAMSAVTSVLGLLSRDQGAAASARRRILDIAIDQDIQEASVKGRELVTMPGHNPLMHYTHELPLMTLSLLSLNALRGLEDQVAELIKPSLSGAISHMREHSDAIHTFAAGTGVCESDVILSAILFCGLAADHAVAVSKVEAGVKAKVKEMRLFAKRERIKPGANLASFNLASNLLADGFEVRLMDMARRGAKMGLIVCPALSKPNKLAPAPVIKQYKLPG